MHQMVRFALDRWGAADHAAVVASVQREPHRRGDEPFGGADVEWLGPGAEDDGDDLSVAGQAAYGGCGQVIAEDGLPDRAGGRGFESVVVDGDGEVRLRTVPGNVLAERLATCPVVTRPVANRPVVTRPVVTRSVVTGGVVDLWQVFAGAVGGGAGGAVSWTGIGGGGRRTGIGGGVRWTGTGGSGRCSGTGGGGRCSGWGGVGDAGGGGEEGGEGVGLAFVAGAGIGFAVDGLVRFGAAVDEGAEEFGVLVGQVAAELHPVVGGFEGQGFALVGAVLVGFGSVGVEDVADAVGRVAELFRGEGAGEFDELAFCGLEVLDRNGVRELVQGGHDGSGLRGVHGTAPFGPLVAVGIVGLFAVGRRIDGSVAVGSIVGAGGLGSEGCLVRICGSVGAGLVRICGSVGGGRFGKRGGGVGEGCCDGLVLGQGPGEANVAARFNRVDAVAQGQEPGGVTGADVLGVTRGVEVADEVQGVGLQPVQLGDGRIEARQLLAVVHRPGGPFAEDLHADNSRHAHRQFPSREPLIFKGILSTGKIPGCPQKPIEVSAQGVYG